MKKIFKKISDLSLSKKLAIGLFLSLTITLTAYAALPRGIKRQYKQSIEINLAIQESLNVVNNSYLLDLQDIKKQITDLESRKADLEFKRAENSDRWNSLQKDNEEYKCKLDPTTCPQKLLTNVLFTSYNAERAQTDSTPCIAGGTGYNVCEMAREGKRVIALSQELIQWSAIGKNGPFKKGDVVTLKSSNYPNDPRCNGEFIVGDAMNIRFRQRGDIFMLDRKDNISCRADVYL